MYQRNYTLKVKDAIFASPGISRKELLEQIRLNPRTLTQSLAALLRQDVICCKMQNPKKMQGRRATLYYPVKDNLFYVAGLYLDVAALLCVISDSHGKIIKFDIAPFDLISSTITHSAHRVIRILDRLQQEVSVKISSIGITIRDCMDDRYSVLLKRTVSRQLGLPVVGGYPIDAFAWALRRKYPDKKQILTFHYMQILEISLINGMEVDNRGRALIPTLLHLQTEPHGQPCWCGKNGCVGNYINEYVMGEEYALKKGFPTPQKTDFYQDYMSGDEIAKEIFRKAEKSIHLVLKKIIRTIQPALFAIIVLPGEKLMGEMDGIFSGSWIPDSLKKNVEFQVIHVKEQAGYSCACATAECALFHEQNWRTPRKNDERNTYRNKDKNTQRKKGKTV